MSFDAAQSFIEEATQSIQGAQFAQAAALADQSIRLDASNPDAYRVKGVALALGGRLDEALLAFRQAMELGPSDPRGPYNVALHYLTSGDTAGARTYAERAIALDPGHVGARELLERVSEPEIQHLKNLNDPLAEPSNHPAVLAPPKIVPPPPIPAMSPGANSTIPGLTSNQRIAPPATSVPPNLQLLNYQPPYAVLNGFGPQIERLPLVRKVGGSWLVIGWLIYAVCMASLFIMFGSVTGNASSMTVLIKVFVFMWWLGVIWVGLDVVDRGASWVNLLATILLFPIGVPVHIISSRKVSISNVR